MTKDGFTFLAMGFTGAAAGLFKEKYIAAFNVMEAELRRRMAAEPAGPQFQIPQTLPEALRLAADLSEKVEEQKAQIEAAKPKTVFYDKFVEADGLYGYMNGGRALGCHPTLFVRWLKRTYVFYEGSALLPYLKWRADGVVRDHVRNWRRRQGPASRVDNAEGAGISVDTHPARD